MKKYLLIFVACVIVSCDKKIEVDSIFVNAHVYTVNPDFEKTEAFAVKDGKFVQVGTSKDILEKYFSNNIIDAEGQTIVPGFIDAHCHFLTLGELQQQVNLVGTKSFEEVVERIIEFSNTYKPRYIRGRGWDQNDWMDKELPTKALLDTLFPNIPIALTRIDGHAS